ncbi:MAG: RDD family protein [Chitinophagales bacterium]
MKTISINTTQNVPIEYEVALVRDRIFAYIIDGFVIVLIGTGLSFILGIFYLRELYMSIAWLLVFVFYNLISEYFMNGQTLGKKALRLQVVKISGEEATLTDYITRWAFRMVDIYLSLGSIASMLVSSSEKGQRIGDIVANTAVIYKRPSRDVSVRQIVHAYDNKNYRVTYPDARNFSDQEMLILKSVLERSEKYDNTAHEDALMQAAEIVKERLGLTGRINDSRGFLKTVLVDYIVLTR